VVVSELLLAVISLQQSFELMCHAKRCKLTTGDFNNALQNADVQVITYYHSLHFYIEI